MSRSSDSDVTSPSEVSVEEIEGREGSASEGELTEGEEVDGDEAMEGGQLARIITEQREDYDEDQDPKYGQPRYNL